MSTLRSNIASKRKDSILDLLIMASKGFVIPFKFDSFCGRVVEVEDLPLRRRSGAAREEESVGDIQNLVCDIQNLVCDIQNLVCDINRWCMCASQGAVVYPIAVASLSAITLEPWTTGVSFETLH